MKPLAKKIIIFLVLFVLGYFVGKQIAKAQSAPTNTLLYEISGKGLKQPSYLYGTFHVLCANDLLLTETIKSKLNASEQLVLELDMDDPNFMTQMQANMMLDNGKTLKNYLSESEYASVNQFFKDSLKMPLEQMISIKPFMLSAMFYPKYLGCTPASWEMTLVQLVQEKKMEVLGLETVEEQIKVLNALSYEEQAKVLLEGVKEYQKSKSIILNMLALYKTQNIEEMYKISKEYFDGEMKGLEKTMLADRNHNWIPKMSKLSTEKSTFYAVGAGHLGGETGVIALLQKEGYTVKPIENEIAKLLIRQWKPEASMIPQMVEDVIENVRKQNAEQAKQIEAQKEMLAQVLGNVITEYKSDNTYEIAIPSSPQSGTWKLSVDNKQIIRTDKNGKESINEILEISDKKLVVLNSEKKKVVYVAL
jgi:uncharacterized protein